MPSQRRAPSWPGAAPDTDRPWGIKHELVEPDKPGEAQQARLRGADRFLASLGPAPASPPGPPPPALASPPVHPLPSTPPSQQFPLPPIASTSRQAFTPRPAEGRMVETRASPALQASIATSHTDGSVHIHALADALLQPFTLVGPGGSWTFNPSEALPHTTGIASSSFATVVAIPQDMDAAYPVARKKRKKKRKKKKCATPVDDDELPAPPPPPPSEVRPRFFIRPQRTLADVARERSHDSPSSGSRLSTPSGASCAAGEAMQFDPPRGLNPLASRFHPLSSPSPSRAPVESSVSALPPIPASISSNGPDWSLRIANDARSDVAWTPLPSASPMDTQDGSAQSLGPASLLLASVPPVVAVKFDDAADRDDPVDVMARLRTVYRHLLPNAD